MKLIGNLLIGSFDEFDFESLNDEIFEEISEDLSDNFLENNIIEENKNFIIKTKIYRFDENGKKLIKKELMKKLENMKKIEIRINMYMFSENLTESIIHILKLSNQKKIKQFMNVVNH